ncbi:flagellar protein FlaG [Paenibacillus thalictri]|uniref:Flagellar protein FlaG n=1 Tax=Paenibacillus thalictri TaxID=2527873 RepID=A0A4Q9DL12_9BACL|nr:flagellar protein FlaG [Paenibacillus thalictri]TBL73015.1 flagellar protein FlaG [Paenibacillus thalictri]
MSSNLSIGGSTSSNVTPSVYDSKDKKADSSTTNENEVAASIRTEKDMKLAELRGEQIPISDEHLIKVIDKALKIVQGSSTSLKFSIHDKTKQIMVKVINNDTGETIREIPPEKMQDLIAKLWDLAGLFVDKRS